MEMAMATSFVKRISASGSFTVHLCYNTYVFTSPEVAYTVRDINIYDNHDDITLDVGHWLYYYYKYFCMGK